MDHHLDDVAARIARVRARLEEDLAQEPPLEELARQADLSPFHFHRLFRGLVGETVRGYQRRLRLERAAFRLEHGDEDVLELALEAGYGSHEAFSRAFRRQLGCSPSEYRQGVRAAAEAPPAPLEVALRERPSCTVARVRHVGPYAEVGAAWKRLMAWGWTRCLLRRPETFGLCHDDPDVTEAGRVRYDACMVVPAGTRPRGEVEIAELPGGPHAVAHHRGEYAGLGATYAGILAAVVRGQVPGGPWHPAEPPSLEVYLDDPRRTPGPELRTEVWLPLRGG